LFVTGLLQLDVALLTPPADRTSTSLLFVWVATLSGPSLLVQRFRRSRLNDAGTRARMAAALSADDRRPLLYLRPFEMDATIAELESPDAGPFGRFFGNPNPRTVEQNLQIALSMLGPVDAIGNPTDLGPHGTVLTLPPPGVRKFYVDHPDWQKEVLSRIGEAQLIALVPGDDFHPDKGFMWELRQIKRLAAPDRVVFFIPHGERYYTKFKQATASLLPDLPAYPRKTIGNRMTRLPGLIQAVLYFDDGWKPVLVPLTGTKRVAPRLAIISALRPVFDRSGVNWHPRLRRFVGRQFALVPAALLAVWPGVLLFTAVFNATFPAN
jgi:hypothetical protein